MPHRGAPVRDPVTSAFLEGLQHPLYAARDDRADESSDFLVDIGYYRLDFKIESLTVIG